MSWKDDVHDKLAEVEERLLRLEAIVAQYGLDLEEGDEEVAEEE